MRSILFFCVLVLTGCETLNSAKWVMQPERKVTVCRGERNYGKCSRVNPEQSQAILRSLSRPATGSGITP
jgi:hypothetical protein